MHCQDPNVWRNPYDDILMVVVLGLIAIGLVLGTVWITLAH
jgi:hypothetical protein